ncbi:MAG: class IV adenylate cyclase [Patescibacteria group bacterium]
MQHINIEIKAKTNRQDEIREMLKSKKADFKGVDHQVDTYYNVKFGRLKLREGEIENYLIHYDRENQVGPKQSNVILYKSDPKSSLKEILVKSLGVLVVVDKMREIYFIDNVKFHLDLVQDLGTFMEIEAIDETGNIGKEKLQAQCEEFIDLFQIKKEDLLAESYSDLLLGKIDS